MRKAAELAKSLLLPFILVCIFCLYSSSSPHVCVSLNGIFALEDGVSQSFSDRKATASQGNAGLKQVLPWQPAMPLVGHLITTDLPGNGYGQSTCHVETAVPLFWISQALSLCPLPDWRTSILRDIKTLWDIYRYSGLHIQILYFIFM